jgi:hypothetical protein
MVKTQISREGDRFEVPIDITRLSTLVTTIIDINEDGDGNDSENGIDERRRHEIPLVSINSLLLAKIVRFLQYYKQEPSQFVMCFGLICYSRVEHLLMIKMIVSSANITPPFISSRIGDIVQEEYAQMVEVDKIMLFLLHAAADLMEIKPLVELASLGIRIGYVWVRVFDF